jgi:hypothetical protein
MEVAYFDSLDFDKLLYNLGSGDDWTSSSDSSFDDCNIVEDGSYYSSSNYHISEGEIESFNGDITSYDQYDENAPARKKNKFRIHAVRHDIRRSYAAMFTNVINAVDFRLLYGFLDTYFVRDLIQDNDKYHMNTKENFKSSCDGILSTANYWYNSAMYTPDGVTSFFDSKIYTSSDPNNNRVVSMYSSVGTKIYDFTKPLPNSVSISCDKDYIREITVDGDDDTASESSEESTLSLGEKRKLQRERETQNKINALNRVIDSLQNLTDYLPLLETPVKIKSLGRMTMHTDANNFITRIVFEKTYMEVPPTTEGV